MHPGNDAGFRIIRKITIRKHYTGIGDGVERKERDRG